MADTGQATLKRTPLHDEHVRLRAKMVPFAGYEMPVQYPTGIVAEHRAVREAVGLFDVSHMGELEIGGPEALEWVQQVVTNDASKIEVGQAQYAALCNEQGGVIDDCITYRFDDRYMIVVNASNLEKDREWILGFADRFDATLVDRSDDIALLALQGPRSADVLARLTDSDLDAIGYYRFTEGAVAGRRAVISRTGYTGEDGFELYLDAGDAAHVWRALLEAGEPEGILPAGLGARDSLRLEMGYALYGNDLDESHNAIESGLGWVVKPDKGDFAGRGALVEAKQSGVERRLVGFELKERGFPRQGYELRHEGRTIGTVTSGAHSHSLDRGIGMGYVETALAKPGTAIDIVVRGKPIPAEIVRPPFYKQGSIRR
ncbi:MAG TPA: glycine cleavage system aminomethyltransferase GcvT [Longimicrobiales bacterium]|nr:glycine cleavage system aminomethyltransferase GcvT [Longimicrobiales bacterium]